MIPTLIVLGLLALGVGIVAFATRRPSTRQDVIVDSDVAGADPITPADIVPIVADPFAHAPVLTPSLATEPAPADVRPEERAS